MAIYKMHHKGRPEYGMERLRLLGLLIEGGETQLAEDGLWLRPEFSEEVGSLVLEKGKLHTIHLPHHIVIRRNLVDMYINPELMDKIELRSPLTKLSVGFEGKLVVRIKALEELNIVNLLKLNVIPVRPDA